MSLSFRYKTRESFLYNIRIRDIYKDFIRFYRKSYRITRTSKAVVCGGILIVIKLAWRTRTRRPGTRFSKFIGLPIGFRICASSDKLNRMTEDRLPSLTVVKLLPRLSTSTILPTVTSSLRGRPTTCMTYAAACGGILLVVALENAAFTVIPVLRSLSGIRSLLP